jgi:hypothetical protein
MSRLAAAFSLVAALSSVAAAAPSFAKPPPQMPVAATVEAAPADSMMRVPVTRASVRAMLIQNRAANLARFRAYQQMGSFPSNVYTGSALNVWRDEAGKLCAAATIIRASGETALVDRIAEDDNFIRLANVTSGPMLDWILTSGLTQAELALIQRPFMPVTKRPSVEEPATVAISPSLRAKETARLAKLYREIDATLVRNQKRSLDAAVDRLMKSPQLAQQLVHGHTDLGQS